jgi:hypothetical protein
MPPLPNYDRQVINMNDTGYDPLMMETRGVKEYLEEDTKDNIAILYNGKLYLSSRSTIEQQEEDALVYECLEGDKKTFQNIVGNLPLYNIKKIGLDLSSDNAVGVEAEYIYMGGIDSLLEEEQQNISEQLQLAAHQILAFSGIEYEEPIAAFDGMKPWNKNFRSVCFAGLANPIPFFMEGRNRSLATIEMALNDHHEYTPQDVARIRKEWINFGQENTVLLTTEKDVVKCKSIKELEDLPLYFLRMKIKFIAGETALLNAVNEVKK